MAAHDLTQPHVRLLVAFLRHLSGPLLFEPGGYLFDRLSRVVVPCMKLFVLAVDAPPNLTLGEVGIIVEQTKGDVIVMRLLEDDEGWRVSVDIVMHEGGLAEVVTEYVPWRGRDGGVMFVPTGNDDFAIRLRADGLVLCDLPYADDIARIEGLGRAAAELMMVVDGSGCLAVAPPPDWSPHDPGTVD